ncbi:hypothetical protein DD237_004022 [Peronospora effusa]|uniref:Uncharacterized protein n=1 Tax=Peronospora effusa TaxID=542832 RepID=A0A425CF34_9STRA|nr:hypothetical protein DD237_004022 [Peronospora effusa]
MFPPGSGSSPRIDKDVLPSYVRLMVPEGDIGSKRLPKSRRRMRGVRAVAPVLSMPEQIEK